MVNLLISAALLIAAFFGFQTKQSTDEIHGIMARHIYPLVKRDGTVLEYDTTEAKAYFFKNMILYMLPYDDIQINDSSYVKKEKYKCFIAYQDSSVCYRVDSLLTRIDKKRLLYDTAMKNYWLATDSSSQAFYRGNYKLLSKQRNSQTGTLIERYEFWDKLDTNYVSIGEYTFTNSLSWMHLRYNQSLEKFRGMRLQKYLLTSRKQFYKPIGDVLPDYTWTFEISELNIPEKQKSLLLKLFTSI